jgi:hypothetical protein
MIFGGENGRRWEESGLTEEREDVITGAYVLDLATLTWRPVAYDWTNWSRRLAPRARTPDGEPLNADITACWSCSASLAVRGGSFFARGLLYDARSQTIQRVVPVKNPVSWTDPPGVTPQFVRALDDDHVLMTVPGSPDVLVLDIRTRSWCSATLPAAVAELAAGNMSGPADVSAHDGRLYLWRSHSAYEMDAMPPPPCAGAEPREGCDLVITPANGFVVTFAWDDTGNQSDSR